MNVLSELRRLFYRNQNHMKHAWRALFFLSIVAGSGMFFHASAQTEAFPHNLTFGDTGADVAALQSILITGGFLNVPAPTGYFGVLTMVAVENWQRSVDLPSTGFFGPLSRAAIGEVMPAEVTSSSAIIAPVPVASANSSGTSSVSSTGYSRNLTIGDSGADVSALQSLLIAKGYLAISAPTGYFGKMTSAALVKLQAAAGLPATGYFGKLSRALVTSTAIENITATNPTPYIASAQAAQAPVDEISPTSTAITSMPIVSDGGGGGGGGGGGSVSVPNTPPDTTPPTISITSPVSSSTVLGDINVTVNASDNVGVTKVEFYMDGILDYTTTIAPFTFPLNTTTLANGAHVLSAKAYDAAGNVGTAAGIPINVVILHPTTPTNLEVTTTTPLSISLSWSASSEASGTIVGYKIYRGVVWVGTVDVTSFTDTGLTASTTYSYSVASYDAIGNTSAKSSAISVTTQAPILNYNFGLSIGEHLLGLSTTTLSQELNDIASLGIGWLRFDVEWDHVQPNNSSSYNWAYIDPFVTAANARHIKLLAVLDYTPAWARTASCEASVGTDRCPPADPNAFATFAAAAVAHYTPLGITDWEIWNEPNLGSNWEPEASATSYTALLESAYTAIKTQDPNTVVIMGGMAPATSTDGNIGPASFLSQLYQDGAEPYFDAVGFHPYSYPAMPSYLEPWNAWQQMANTTPSLRSVMIANGDASKKIWMTEYGAPTGGPGVLETSATDTIFAGNPDHVTEALQAQMISQAITLVGGYPWAGPLFFYTYQDQGTSTSTNENFFGILRYDGSEKPAYTTIQDLVGDGQ